MLAFSSGPKECFPSDSRHIFETEVQVLGNPMDLRTFHSSLGLPTFSSNLFTIKYFFLFFIKNCT